MATIVSPRAASSAASAWLRGFVLGIPRGLDEAAMVDGSTRFGAFFRILLPLVAPGLVATSIFAFIQVWNEFIIAYIVLSSPENHSCLAATPVATRAAERRTCVRIVRPAADRCTTGIDDYEGPCRARIAEAVGSGQAPAEARTQVDSPGA